MTLKNMSNCRGLGQGNTYVLQEDLEDTTGFLIDETRDTLDTTTTSETTNGGLGDTCSQDMSKLPAYDISGRRTLNVVTKNLTVTLGTALS